MDCSSRLEDGTQETQGLYVFLKDTLFYVQYISNVWKIRTAYVSSTSVPEASLRVSLEE